MAVSSTLKTGEEPQHDYATHTLVLLLHALERFVDGQEIYAVFVGQNVGDAQRHALPGTAVPDPPSPSSTLDQDASHGLGGRGEELRAPGPGHGLAADEAPGTLHVRGP